jgi:glycosyltransferase involved in cell wall biosynthesis
MARKLGVVGLRGFPDVMGGVETHCETLYGRIAATTDEFDIVVFARSPYVAGDAYVFRHCRIEPIWTVKHPTLEAALHTLLAFFYARFAENCRFVHVHAIGPGLFIPLARLLGMHVVATHHGHDYQRLKWGPLAKAALRLGEWCMLRYSAQVICVSGSSAERLKREHPHRADHIVHIPNGIDTSAPPPPEGDILADIGVRPGAYVLAVGRLVPEKGFQDLVAAFERTRLPHKLVIVGAADHADHFSRTLLEKASSRVVFAGKRRRGEVAALYRDAALFVLPSYHEGNPLVALEALTAEAPILLSDIAPNRDFGLPARHYFPVGDVEALAKALERADFEGLRVRGGGIRQRYNWRHITERTLSVLRKAVSGRPARAGGAAAEGVAPSGASE